MKASIIFFLFVLILCLPSCITINIYKKEKPPSCITINIYKKEKPPSPPEYHGVTPFKPKDDDILMVPDESLPFIIKTR